MMMSLKALRALMKAKKAVTTILNKNSKTYLRKEL
jgi:hypothetical protein